MGSVTGQAYRFERARVIRDVGRDKSLFVVTVKVATRFDFTTSDSELAYKRNSIGPKIEPLETPAVTGSASEDTPDAVTL